MFWNIQYAKHDIIYIGLMEWEMPAIKALQSYFQGFADVKYVRSI